MPETILVERAQVVTVTLNRPERKNAANGQMWSELRGSSTRSRMSALTGC